MSKSSCVSSGKQRSCVFANGAVNCDKNSWGSADGFRVYTKICLWDATKGAPFDEQKQLR